jgi:DNA polymerase III delta subunit
MTYLLIGEDEPAKAEKIQFLKKQLLNPRVEQFNFDIFYGRELTLPLFQEALSRLPVSSDSRLLVIKDALGLKEGPREYFLSRLNSLPSSLVIIMDVSVIPREDNLFLSQIRKAAKTLNFMAGQNANAFNLAKALEGRRTDSALNILSDLLKQGERPERILGALRSQLTRCAGAKERLRRIALLLEADLNVKTGRLKPAQLALEALVVKLCR